MNKLNHLLRKIPSVKTPHAVFLLSHCKELHEDQDGTSELNSPIVDGYYEF